jgi:thiamine-monophosphate kinase
MSTRFSPENIEELYEGINLACHKYKIDLAGGDTTSSLTGLTIGVTAIGSVEKEKIVKRNGARPNDLICVTGDFGAAYLGLQLLERERKIFSLCGTVQPDLSGYEYVIGRQLKPEFPADTLTDLDKNGILPTSMIDVSEGLSSDLLNICKLSGTGCRIYNNKIPIDTETSKVAEELAMDPSIPALNGGEDYELLFTVPLEFLKKLKVISSVRVIGHITSPDQGNYIVGDDGSEVKLTSRGWGDFK